MGIAEARQQFSAYGSGQLPEFELRGFIRRAVQQEPQLSYAIIEMTDAYRRANVIGDELHSTITADIDAVTRPMMGATIVRKRGTEPLQGAWVPPVSAANSTDVGVAPGSTGNSDWDMSEGLTEVGAQLYPGSILRDRFVLVEELGRGGMGVVYKAYDRSRGDVKDRYVAIKVLNEEFKRHPLAVRSLQREARKAQRLAHPNIVGVHDFDRDGGNVYMVMEYLSGRSLDQVLKEDGQRGIPAGPAKEIIKGLAAALSYAHEQDIVHCDFKPSNAFLLRDGKVKVLDFGIARAAPSVAEKGDTTLFDAGDLGAISPAYASLEMLQREQPDVRDDIYSFACVSYELLTGCHPYQRLDAVRAYQAGLEPRRLGKMSRREWRALKRGLAFRRPDRTPTIDSLARELSADKNRTQLWVGAAAAGVVAVALAVGAYLKWGHTDRAGVQQPTAVAQPMESAPAQPAPAAAFAPQPTGAPATEAPTPAVANRNSARSGTARIGPASASGPTTATATSHGAGSNAAGIGPAAGSGPATAGAATVASPGAIAGPGTAAGPAAGSADTPTPAIEAKRAAVEILREQLERQADEGDIDGAATTAKLLQRSTPGSSYVAREIPRLLPLSYINLAKTQFAGGKMLESLQTIEAGRQKYGASTELKDLHFRYVAVANIYDPLRFAVALNPSDMKSRVEDLKPGEGNEYDTATRMLAQTLADRIADQRAAQRDGVADRLLEAGKQIFPSHEDVLTHGKAGALPDVPLEISDP
jgi:serine/threonine protein kinase